MRLLGQELVSLRILVILDTTKATMEGLQGCRVAYLLQSSDRLEFDVACRSPFCKLRHKTSH